MAIYFYLLLFTVTFALFFSCSSRRDDNVIREREFIGLIKDSLYLGINKTEALKRNPNIRFDQNSDGFISLFDIEVISDSLAMLSSAFYEFDEQDKLDGLYFSITITCNYEETPCIEQSLSIIRRQLFFSSTTYEKVETGQHYPHYYYSTKKFE